MNTKYKTWKREAALLCLVYLGYVGLYGRIEVIDALSWPIFLFAGAAFGMDWADKSTVLPKKV